jgi:hypothetical protein
MAFEQLMAESLKKKDKKEDKKDKHHQHGKDKATASSHGHRREGELDPNQEYSGINAESSSMKEKP